MAQAAAIPMQRDPVSKTMEDIAKSFGGLVERLKPAAGSVKEAGKATAGLAGATGGYVLEKLTAQSSVTSNTSMAVLFSILHLLANAGTNFNLQSWLSLDIFFVILLLIWLDKGNSRQVLSVAAISQIINGIMHILPQFSFLGFRMSYLLLNPWLLSPWIYYYGLVRNEETIPARESRFVLLFLLVYLGDLFWGKGISTITIVMGILVALYTLLGLSGFVPEKERLSFAALVKLALTAWVIGLVLYFSSQAIATAGIKAPPLPQEMLKSPIPAIAEVLGGAKEGVFGRENPITAVGQGLKNLLAVAIAEAAGDYYTTGEAAQEPPKGLLVEETPYTDKEFDSGKKAVVRVTAEMISKVEEPISVLKTSCEVDDENGRKGLIEPEKFDISYGENYDLSCTFDSGFVGSPKTISFYITYEFKTKTETPLTIYFMDRQMARQEAYSGINPVKGRSLDPNPKPKYTNGPVELTLGIQKNSLVDIAKGTDKTKNLFIKLSPRSDWNGEISKMKKITVEMPKGVKIKTGSCDQRGWSHIKDNTYEFKDVDEELSDIKAGKEQSLGCPLEIEYFAVLGDGDFAIKEINIEADYEFTVKKDIEITITAPKTGTTNNRGKTPQEYVEGDNSQVEPTIRQVAEELGIPYNVALAVAKTESGAKHWEGSNVRLGDGENSVGVMQISLLAHQSCKGAISYDSASSNMCIRSKRCNGKTIYDLGCNIEAGLRFLKSNYESEDKCNKVCKTINCEGTDYEYCGWECAARQYNGWACCYNNPVPGDCGSYVKAYKDNGGTI